MNGVDRACRSESREGRSRSGRRARDDSDEDLADASEGDKRMMKLMEIVMKKTVGSGLL